MNAMTALPALSAVATDAVRRQFDETGSAPEPVHTPTRRRPAPWRIALAAALERAAHAVAPAERVAAH